jgi:predicted ATPase/DNA-binding SARP family transcriptional activator
MRDNQCVFFGILGALEVRHTDGTPVAVGGPRSRALLALLLLDPGQIVGVQRLIDGLYGENPPSGAANALQSQVSRLRRGLRGDTGSGDLVEFHPAGYRLAVDPDDVDAHRFVRLARAGQRALTGGDHARAAASLREALGLWRGPALADVADAPFAAAQAARLDELRVTAVEDRAEAELALGGHRTVVAELQDLVAAHPLRERPRAQLMRALYGSGRQAEALAVYEEARQTLAEELGADPSAELAAVHVAILRADPSLTAPAAPSPTVPAPGTSTTTVPTLLTSFVGREAELRRISTLLGETRLVTLVGPGGAGKTRLAIEAGRRAQDAGRAAGEICFVDLAPLGDGAEVPQAVLGALGLREIGLLPGTAGEPDPVTRLVAALADRRMLLILDNCEHVIENAARLSHRLLGACPELRVLATSREALGITGETLRPLPPLTFPAAGTPAGETLRYPAVRLFADRAAAVRPNFAVDAGNADAVLRICGALDGLPLAIELAAARLRSLPIEDVAARLDDRFRLLSRGDRTAAPRHQTLRAVVEWSWDLLGDAERLLARRLTVFAGGVTFDAAVRVCRLPANEVDELLADLADKSLVQRDGDRYRMLDTVRVFCAERLAAAGEEERLHRAHAEYVLDLAETASPYLLRAEQVEWLARLTTEHGNLHAALRWAVRGDPPLALRLLGALSWYWWLRGLRGETAPLATELLDVLGDLPDGRPAVPAGLGEEYVLCVLNALSSGHRTPELQRRMDQAESIIEATDAPPRRPYVLVLWAMSTPIPSPDTISHRRRRLIGRDPWFRALDQFSLGYMRLFGGDPAAAESDFDMALDAFREVGDRWGLANTLDALAELVDLRGDRERSYALINESLGLVEQLGAVEDMAELLCRRADRLARGGELSAAQADYESAAVLARRAGKPMTLAAAQYGLGELARLRGDTAEARRLLELAQHGCTTDGMTVDMTRWRILVALGRLAAAAGDAGAARSHHRQAFTAAAGRQHLQSAAHAVEGLAGVALLDDDGERAALLLGIGRALRGGIVPGDPDVARVAARARELVGDAAYTSTYERGATMSQEEALATVGS